jgi:hypothetical protein
VLDESGNAIRSPNSTGNRIECGQETSSTNPLAGEDRAADALAVARTNLFLAAIMQGDGFSAPVKVRNMSATGALVEAAAGDEDAIVSRIVNLRASCRQALARGGR